MNVESAPLPTSPSVPLAVWLVGGAAALAVTRPRARNSVFGRYSPRLVNTPQLTRSVPSLFQAFLRNGLGGSKHLASGLAGPGPDDPVQIYPGDPIAIVDPILGPIPGSEMQFVPDSPGSTHGKIVWHDTPVIPPGAKYATYGVTVTRNGQNAKSHYILRGRTFSGVIEDVNAGDVINFHQRAVAVDSRGNTTIVNVPGTVQPIRIPSPGQTDGGPGRWVYIGSESGMKSTPRYYQQSVTHTAVPWVYEVNGAHFDGFYIDKSGGKHLLEAKGNYAWLADQGGAVVPWGLKTHEKTLGQIIRQRDAARGSGASVDWYIQNQGSIDYFVSAAGQAGTNFIKFHLAPKGRPN
ncbi:Tox-REase-5 domain-containing protein [Gordonia sp. CPCC 205333]|uniref:Tox-REase-5 domain-containing protein n=1 Tax=Gordonia sp. CPCC 205333 TaxID=3140790 RepID=UPI003AF34EFF